MSEGITLALSRIASWKRARIVWSEEEGQPAEPELARVARDFSGRRKAAASLLYGSEQMKPRILRVVTDSGVEFEFSRGDVELASSDEHSAILQLKSSASVRILYVEAPNTTVTPAT